MPAPEPPPPSLPFRLPADYYTSPERTRIFPRAVPIGCGSAAALFLVVLFAAGALVSGDRGGRLMGSLFAMMQSEMEGQFTKDVPAADKAEFDAQFHELRHRVETGRAKLSTLQPLLEKMRDASMDEKITPEETKRLIEALRGVNR
ncbi:MAG TPA: hypothetical protein VJZ76_12320 [Thermoanaerobaculia bacterium]|nr:hypothetical protein [Thermoanaerobaculia bacterium]